MAMTMMKYQTRVLFLIASSDKFLMCLTFRSVPSAFTQHVDAGCDDDVAGGNTRHGRGIIAEASTETVFKDKVPSLPRPRPAVHRLSGTGR